MLFVMFKYQLWLLFSFLLTSGILTHSDFCNLIYGNTLSFFILNSTSLYLGYALVQLSSELVDADYRNSDPQ